MSEITKKVSELIDKLAKDWDKLAGFVKFCLVISSFILLAGWSISDQQQIALGLRFSVWLYIVLLLFVFILPLLFWICECLYILRMRIRYPLKNIGMSFQFILAGDPVYIVDTKRKHIRWIENPRSLYDLGFSPYWSNHLIKKTMEELTRDGYVVKHGLRTRLRPGLLKENQ